MRGQGSEPSLTQIKYFTKATAAPSDKTTRNKVIKGPVIHNQDPAEKTGRVLQKS